MEPTKFGRYEIKNEIGRGGMATVYHAYDPRFEREVALKVLPHEMLHDLQFRTRFEREAKTIAMLEHPAIVPVYDFGEEEGQPYFVMRYMTGGSLSDRMKKGPLSVKEVAHLIEHIAPALDEAHAKGIIHRDLKPGNILYDQFNEPYISDFGIAKLSESKANVTGSAIVGTPAYMSPEQAQGETIDGRSDIYGLGVILFELLTGQQPYHGDTPMSVVVKQITDPVPHILDVKPDLPPDVELIIEKAMAKDRNERFQNVKSLSDALNAVARGESLSLGPADSTVVSSKTTISKPASQPIAGTVVSRPITFPQPAGPKMQVPAIPEPAQTPAEPRKKTGLWIGLGGGAVVIVCILLAVIGFSLRNKIPFLAGVKPSATSQLVQVTDTLTLPPVPTATNPQIALPVSTNTPSPSDTPSASPTPTVQPVPTLGGADQIAFLSARDIWIANVDGTNASQITKDGTDKHDLQWAPDGKSIFYISGKCIQNVDTSVGKVSTIACFNSADFVDAFAISPDGTQVAISVNHVLNIVPFDLTVLSGVRSLGQLAITAGNIIKYPDITQGQTIKQVRWLPNGKRIAVDSITPTGTGLTIDNIVIYDLTACTKTTPCDGSNFFQTKYITQFPFGRFSMNGYGTSGGNYSIIPAFDWNEDGLFLLNSITRNGVYGYLYSYNSASFKNAAIDPLGTQCCYTDTRWSPDGSYIIFAYQDITQGGAAKTQMYYVQFGSIGTGAKFTPLPLPATVLTNPTDHPEPVLRPAK